MDGKVQVKARVKSNSGSDARKVAGLAGRAGDCGIGQARPVRHGALRRRPRSSAATAVEHPRDRRPRRRGAALRGGGEGAHSWLSKRAADDLVDLVGPLGNGFSIKSAASSLLLVAGGIGIAPLVFLAEEALRLGKRVTMLQGARRRALLCPKEQLPSRGHGRQRLVTMGSDGKKRVGNRSDRPVC